MTLVGKVLPLQLTGADNGPVLIVTGVVRHEDRSEPPIVEHEPAPALPPPRLN